MGNRPLWDRLLIAGMVALIVAWASMTVWLTYADFRARHTCIAAGYLTGSSHFDGTPECVIAPARTVRAPEVLELLDASNSRRLPLGDKR